MFATDYKSKPLNAVMPAQCKRQTYDNASATASASFVQPKLRIGPSDNIFEKEADAVADMVVSTDTPDPVNFSSMNNLQRKCAHCEEEEKKELSRKESSDAVASAASPIVYDVLNSSGKPLDEHTRSFMESRFNYDFSDVKIHDSDLAAKSASFINALAYTSGNNIVFNSGQYNTNSDSGKRLLAHELTHVVQQSQHENYVSPFIQRDLDCESRSWPDDCSAPGGCDAGKQCGAMKDWSSCACWDTAGEQRMREAIPSWVLALLGGAALLALIACFATGVCEIGIIVAGLGAAAAAVLLGILRSLGLVGDRPATVAMNDETADGTESS
jgi:Domain of unknown function (DUF4157)